LVSKYAEIFSPVDKAVDKGSRYQYRNTEIEESRREAIRGEQFLAYLWATGLTPSERSTFWELLLKLHAFCSVRTKHSTTSIHIYEIRPRADKHGFDLSSDALRYSPLWYRGSNAIVDAVAHARSYSRRHPVVIRVYDGAGDVIETHEHKGGFKEW
jgi:hypothetical protein